MPMRSRSPRGDNKAYENTRKTVYSNLHPWIIGKVSAVKGDRGHCRRLILKQSQANGSLSHDVEVVVFESRDSDDAPPGPDEIADAADTLTEAAVADAEGIGQGLQRYVVLAIFDSEDKDIARKIITIDGGSISDRFQMSDGGGITSSENPNELTGHLAQVYRHNEAATQTGFRAMEHALGVLQAENNRLASQVEDMSSKQIQTIKVFEDLMDRKTERDIAIMKEKTKADAIGDTFNKLQVLLPVVANKIAGKNVFPEQSNPQVESLKGLVGSLDPEQLDQLRGILKPEQILALISMMETIAEEKGIAVPDDDGQGGEQDQT